MIYYEAIIPMTLYRKHEISSIRILSERPGFSQSAWLQLFTTEGKVFFVEKQHLEDMQKYPEWYPLEERGQIAPAQKERQKETAPDGSPTPQTV